MPSSSNTSAAPRLAQAATSRRSVFAVLLPITFAVFLGFLAIGMVLPVLPLHIHGTLGMGTWVVGIAAGAQFAAALLSRAWAGAMADTRGAKTAVVSGLVMAAAAGLAYLLSTQFNHEPGQAVGLILLGRVLQGCAESLIVTGALSWGVGLVGPHNVGKVMAWVGIAIYGAYAGGAPLGVHLHGEPGLCGAQGFAAVAGACVMLPTLAWGFIAWVKPLAPSGVQRMPFYKVLGQVWVPGLGLALSSAGFGLLTAFIPLLFTSRSWGNPSLAFTAFGVAFIGARLLFGHLPDKVGGAKVALICVLIEAGGQAMIWLAPTPVVAFVGAALTGFGYSLAFPGFGVESVKRAPPQNRGAAMGAYVAFLDIALGLINPGAGALAGVWGIEAVFFFGTLVVAGGSLVALWLLWAVPVAEAGRS